MMTKKFCLFSLTMVNMIVGRTEKSGGVLKCIEAILLLIVVFSVYPCTQH